jgi:cytochrome P450
MSTGIAEAGAAAARDDRKTAHFIAVKLKPFKADRIESDFLFVRELLRTPGINQGRPGVAPPNLDNPDHESFFFLDGERHRKRRASVASYFTPKAVLTRYLPLMQRTMDEEIAEFQRKGTARLEDMSLQMTSNITMEVVGLTNSDNRELTQIIRGLMNSNFFLRMPRWAAAVLKPLLMGRYQRERGKLIEKLYNDHIVPAAEARRKEPKDDVVSYMVKEGYSKQAMVIECQTYAGAGVTATKEFIVLAAWQLFDHPDLRQRFLEGSEADQIAILEEILRLDPAGNYMYRQSTIELPAADGSGKINPGDVIAINVREANIDPNVVGDEPFAIDPDRTKRTKNTGSWMSFGDGPHRCPGAQVALQESRVFLDRLFRVPGLRLVKPPELILAVQTQGYELRGCIVACDKA